MQYDGSGKLSLAIAELCGLSCKNSVQIAELIKEAKDSLGIISKSKNLPIADKLAIWQWHYERLNPVQDIKQDSHVQHVKQTGHDDAVQDIKQAESVQDIKQDDDTDLSLYDYDQLHFAVTITHKGQPKRTTVMLEGYLVKALQRKHGLTDNPAIRAWIEQAIKADGGKFDSHEPLTKQVKRMIIESFV